VASFWFYFFNGDVMYEIQKINGVTFIFSPFKDIETASFGIFLRVGSRYEPRHVRGIAHFLEHMLFKGSKKYSYKEIKREIEGRGGSLNGFTSQEITAYYAHFLNKNLDQAADILLDMVFDSLLKNTDLQKERMVILEEIKMYNDLPSSRAAMLLDKLLWCNHALGEEVVGHYETVNRINRGDLVAFKNNYYVPDGIIVCCSGNFSQDRVITLLSEKIKNNPKQIKLQSTQPAELAGLHVKVENKKLEQAHLCLGFRSVSYFHEDKFTAELINVILGANMSSRLFEALRERRALCYDISTEARKYKDSGAFTIQLGLDKSRINTALAAILRELAKLKEKEVSAKELARARDYFLGQIAMSLEQPQGKMFYTAESYITLGKIYSMDDIKREVANVSPARIKRPCGDIFNFNNMCVSCIADTDDKEEGRIRKIVAG